MSDLLSGGLRHGQPRGGRAGLLNNAGIIDVSSVAGLSGPLYLTAYAASKWAVRGMSSVYGSELVIDGGVTA